MSCPDQLKMFDAMVVLVWGGARSHTVSYLVNKMRENIPQCFDVTEMASTPKDLKEDSQN